MGMKKTCFSILLATAALCLSSSGLQAQSATYLVVSIVATTPEASETGPSPGAFTISYVGTNAWPSTSVLRVFYRISGTAQNGMDYVAISNWVAIPSGTNAISIPIVPI